MFNMESSGKVISAARRAKNMTQLELADQLGISYQAVSNWERGNSMPDIAKLMDLTALLEIPVEQILGKESSLVSGIVNQGAEAYLDSNKVEPEELLEAAPLLKPGQMDKAYRQCEPPLDFSQIHGILPFLDEALCNQLFERCITLEEPEEAGQLAPFVGEDMIDKTALALYRQDKLFHLFKRLLPFIGDDALKTIADEEYAAHGLNEMHRIVPFLEDEYLNAKAKDAIEKDGIKAISKIAPFLDKELLSQYVREQYL